MSIAAPPTEQPMPIVMAPSAEQALESPARVLMVSSAGGHLSTLCALRPWWTQHNRLWVSFDRPDVRSVLAGERTVWAHHPTTRNLKNAVRNLFLAFKVIRRFRPHVLVSNGAGVAFPFFLVGKLLGCKTVYIEAFERVDGGSLTGRLCYPISDLFLLQDDAQKKLYRRGQTIGRIL